MSPKEFYLSVLKWFKRYGRHNLPWQKNSSPYRTWISEIMLQQTQVSTVTPYFRRFIKTFPNIKTLALAETDEVLAHWSGLGYYARARNLHRTAKIIHETYHGRFPKTVEALSTLPGIGLSTAGAILSLGMNEYAVILDGNVKRVLARFLALDLPINQPSGINFLWEEARKYTPQKNCKDYNQAMMDIGAMICTRTKPKCPLCPLQKACLAQQQSRQLEFPIKKASTSRRKKKTCMLLLKNTSGNILLKKRPSVGIWGGLWSFPECPVEENIETWCELQLGYKVNIEERWPSLFHQFTHFELEIKPVLLQVKSEMLQIMESSAQIWYKEGATLPGGVSAPVARLLSQLTKQRQILNQ